MHDPISRLSAALASDPAGTAWVPLADALRRAGRVEEAERIALRGLERHPYLPDGHDVLARVRAERGDDGGARDEWEMALRLDPGHVASLKGLAFLAHRRQDLAAVERFLRQARDIAPGDERIATAHRRSVAALQAGSTAVPDPPAPVPPPATASPTARPGAHAAAGPRGLFADIEALGGLCALLVDRDGLVLAGNAPDAEGRDASDALGAELSGLGDESARALAQLGLGAWDRVVVECGGATIAFAPVHDGAVVMFASPPATPLGLAHVLLDRARRRADGWLGAL